MNLFLIELDRTSFSNDVTLHLRPHKDYKADKIPRQRARSAIIELRRQECDRHTS